MFVGLIREPTFTDTYKLYLCVDISIFIYDSETQFAHTSTLSFVVNVNTLLANKLWTFLFTLVYWELELQYDTL